MEIWKWDVLPKSEFARFECGLWVREGSGGGWALF